MNDKLRVTYFGNCGTIYSIIWHDSEKNEDNNPEDNDMTLSPGEWLYPFNDDLIEAIIDGMLDMCGNAFLEEEDVFKVIISKVELESLSTTPN